MAENTQDSVKTTVTAPIVVDLGKVKNKYVKRLKKGRGKLMNDVSEALGEVIRNLGAEVDGKEIVPIVVVYRKKKKNSSGFVFPFPFPGCPIGG